MNILENIPPSQRKACIQVAELLKTAGGRALLVGGCVRDGLLGIPAKDVDMEVYGLNADEVERTLKKTFRLDTVGRAFGVFIIKGHDIDLALPRRESKSGPKHTDFVVTGDPSMSPKEAASRRDFTVNAISIDPLTDELLDPYDGVIDLKARHLRHVSAAFSEDPLRVLRGMQFIARFDLEATPETIALCRELSPEHLPSERLWEEWKKLILKGAQPSKGLLFLQACNWLQYFPEIEGTPKAMFGPTLIIASMPMRVIELAMNGKTSLLASPCFAMTWANPSPASSMKRPAVFAAHATMSTACRLRAHSSNA